MKKLSIKDVAQTYNKIKQFANKSFYKGNYEGALRFISMAAELAYNFNWIYVDHDFEKILSQISSKIILKKSYVPLKGRMIIYDAFALDNKGLTQQYIRALISMDVELLFIYEGNDLSNSNNIVKELSLYPKAELFTVDSNLSNIDKIKILYNKVVDFQPEKAFLHLYPSSVVAVCLWNALPQTTRYMINITDHAFWLGTCCIDYCIEFRNYGYTVSFEKRGFNKEQLLLQPYYPITECSSFKGFPAQLTPESIVILTGGAFYKMYGENDIFFGIMKELVNINSNVIILIAGSGDAKPLKDFIAKNNLQERLILIGNRTDINHIFIKCDIYLNTYPFAGGLMSQLAAVNAKPILSYTSPDMRDNFMEGILNWGDNSDWQVTHTTMISFIQEARKLIEEPKYRRDKGEITKGHVITSKEFNVHLKELTKTNTNKITPTRESIDYNNLIIKYLDAENNYLFNFNALLISKFRFSTFLYFPIIGFKSLLSQKIISKILHKFRYDKEQY